MENKGLTEIIIQGKKLLKMATSTFTRSRTELTDICEGLIKLPNKNDSIKLKDTNPYFASIETRSTLSPIVILIIGFHHKEGSIIERAYPETNMEILKTSEYTEFSKQLCFIAIPDAAHDLDVYYQLS